MTVTDPGLLRELREAFEETDEPSVRTTKALAGLLSAADSADRPPIRVERFEQDDGALIIHIDAGDVVAFVYSGDADTLVIDIHRRTAAGEQRLRVLVDGAGLLPSTRAGGGRLMPYHFEAVASNDMAKRDLGLTCTVCGQVVRVVQDGDGLGLLLDVAAGDDCPSPAENGQEEPPWI